jgi:hypothetical protein
MSADVVARAQRDYDLERTALMRHSQQCGWCIDGPCPMGRAVAANADAYGLHLEALQATYAHPEPAEGHDADRSAHSTTKGGHSDEGRGNARQAAPLIGGAARPTNAPGDVPARRTGGRHGPRCPITAPNTKTPPQR